MNYALGKPGASILGAGQAVSLHWRLTTRSRQLLGEAGSGPLVFSADETVGSTATGKSQKLFSPFKSYSGDTEVRREAV